MAKDGKVLRRVESAAAAALQKAGKPVKQQKVREAMALPSCTL
jgi:hypothetical protein